MLGNVAFSQCDEAPFMSWTAFDTAKDAGIEQRSCLAPKAQHSPLAWGSVPGLVAPEQGPALKARFTSDLFHSIVGTCPNH